MFVPIGRRFALHRPSKHFNEVSIDCDPELEEFENQKMFIQANIECDIKFVKNVIPPGKMRLKGVLILKAFENIQFSALYIVMKGLPVNQIQMLAEKHSSNVKFQSNVRFTVEEITQRGGDDGGKYMQIDKNARETYLLDIDIPEELPTPVILADGKLIFKMQAFISTLEGRHVKVGEVPVRWMGKRVLTKEEIYKQLVIEQHVTCKRTFMAFGKRKSCRMEWRVERGGYLPGEGILVEVLGESKDKAGMEVEVFVELVQKVWYQVPPCHGRGTMWVNMGVNILASVGSEKAFQVDEGKDGKKVVWMGKLKVPNGITPTQKFELIHSVSYAIRASVGVAGENKRDWVKGEVPLFIGTSKEVMEEDEKAGNEGGDLEIDEEVDDEQILHQFSPTGSVSHLHTGSRLERRGSGGLTMFKRTQSVAFINGRPRVGSVSSIDSCDCLVSTTLPIFKLPKCHSHFPPKYLLEFGLSP